LVTFKLTFESGSDIYNEWLNHPCGQRGWSKGRVLAKPL
jgi:hypothetical protein